MTVYRYDSRDADVSFRTVCNDATSSICSLGSRNPTTSTRDGRAPRLPGHTNYQGSAGYYGTIPGFIDAPLAATQQQEGQ